MIFSSSPKIFDRVVWARLPPSAPRLFLWVGLWEAIRTLGFGVAVSFLSFPLLWTSSPLSASVLSSACILASISVLVWFLVRCCPASPKCFGSARFLSQLVGLPSVPLVTGAPPLRSSRSASHLSGLAGCSSFLLPPGSVLGVAVWVSTLLRSSSLSSFRGLLQHVFDFEVGVSARLRSSSLSSLR